MAYDAQRYEDAAAAFQRAYDLVQDPLLIFNVAQAQRRLGRCPEALTAYERFLQLDATSPKSADAKSHILTLSTSCGPSRPVVDSPVAVHAAAARPVPPPQRRKLRLVGVGALATGLALLGSSVALHGWNSHRYAAWEREDRALRLAIGAASPDPALPARQGRNNERLREIRAVDRWSLGLGLGGAVALVAGAGVTIALDWDMLVGRTP